MRRLARAVAWMALLIILVALVAGLLQVAVPDQPYEPDPDWQPDQAPRRTALAT